jgi:hypothetical protein
MSLVFAMATACAHSRTPRALARIFGLSPEKVQITQKILDHNPWVLAFLRSNPWAPKASRRARSVLGNQEGKRSDSAGGATLAARQLGGSQSLGLRMGTTLDLGAMCGPGSSDDGTRRASRFAMTVVRLSGSSSNTSRPLASLIVIVALTGSPTSSIPKPSCGPAERGDASAIIASRSSLCDRFTTCGLSSIAATASVVQKREFFR